MDGMTINHIVSIDHGSYVFIFFHLSDIFSVQVLHLPLMPPPVPVRGLLPDPAEAFETLDEGLSLEEIRTTSCDPCERRCRRGN